MSRRPKLDRVARYLLAGLVVTAACVILLRPGSSDALIAWAAGIASFVSWATLR